MSAPRISVERFARAVVHAELARRDPASDSHVAEAIMQRLHREIGTLIGPAGFDVLLARALVLARRGHPSLTRIEALPGGALTGLHDAARDDERGEVAMAIVSHFMELLVSLIGEDLAMRLVADLGQVANEEEVRQ